MSRLKRVCLVFIALILLPYSPARAESQDDIYWSGNVSNQIRSSSYVVTPSDPAHNQGSATARIDMNYIRKITALGNGYAREVVRYTYKSEYTRVCNYLQDPDRIGTHTETREGYSVSVTKPFSVIKTDSWVVIGFILTPVVANFEDVDECTGAATSGTIPIQNQALLTLTSENGEFSAGSTEVYGIQTGSNYILPAGTPPSTGWQSGSYTTIYDLSGVEIDTPWFSPETKQALSDSASLLGWWGHANGLGAQVVEQKYAERLLLRRAVGLIGLSVDLAALIDYILSLDPPDPNYTEITLPVTPTTSQQPILANGDLTQAQTDAFNLLITNFQQGIGLGRAMLTSFDRASGAQQANDSYWVEQQLQAARTYAGQYADVLDARPQLLENLEQALQTDPDLPLDLTSEDLAQFRYELLANGLTTEQEQLLTEMGVDQRGKAQILFSMILAELPQEASLQDPVDRFPDLLIDPELIQVTQELANSLREFAEGSGSKIYLPIVTN